MRFKLNGAVSGRGGMLGLADGKDLVKNALEVEISKKEVDESKTSGARDLTHGEGWMLLVPDDDEGTRIEEALGDLVDHRELDGVDARVLRFPASHAKAPHLGNWVREHIDYGADDDEEAPSHILVAGSPDKMPLKLVHRLAVSYGVGVLSLDEMDQYRTYAEKVLSWDTGGRRSRSKVGAPLALFGTDHGFGDATHASRQHLIEHFADKLKSKRHVRTLMGEGATSRGFKALIEGSEAGLEGPRMLFSATHGLAVPGDDAEARADRLAKQGAIVCQNWFVHGDGDLYGADSLPDGPALEGGVAFLFACFGGGTPASSTFEFALDDPTMGAFHNGSAFYASLPKALLAHPQGPLAVCAHIDPSFTHAFCEPRGRGADRRQVIFRVVRDILRSVDFGKAMNRFAVEVNNFGEDLRALRSRLAQDFGPEAMFAELLGGDERSDLQAMRKELIDLSISLHDFQNFVLLGDPAASMPSADARAERRTSPDIPAPSTLDPLAYADVPEVPDIPEGIDVALLEAHEAGQMIVGSMMDLCSEMGLLLRAGSNTDPSDAEGALAVGFALPASLVVCLTPELEASSRYTTSGTEPTLDTEGDAPKHFFAGHEHQLCDEAVSVRFSGEEGYPAGNYRLKLVNGLQLRYGEILSMAGEFFGDPAGAIDGRADSFERAYETLESVEAYSQVKDVLNTIKDEIFSPPPEEEFTTRGLMNKASKKLASGLMSRFNKATGGGSKQLDWLPPGRAAKLAKVDWDHFSDDARRAYAAGHERALEEALKARDNRNPSRRRQALLRAYSMNAFADRFLTDLFAATHLRVPQRSLLSQVRPQQLSRVMSKYMRVEEGGQGLKVKNARGDDWKAFGDRHFNDPGHAMGRDIIREAVMLSAVEIFQAFETGQKPSGSVLDLLPDIDDARDRTDNHAPLFLLDARKRLMVRVKPLDLFLRDWTPDLNVAKMLLKSGRSFGRRR